MRAGLFILALSVAACGDAAPAEENTSSAVSSFAVTYIGDSHSDYEGNAYGVFGFLGQHMKELMAADGIPLSLYAASGSSPNWWFDDTAVQPAKWGYTQTVPNPPRRHCASATCVPKLGVLTASHPSLIVIEQGTNLLGRSAADITQQITKMLAQIAGKADACLWVGAPNARTNLHSQASQDQLWQLIEHNAAPTCFVYDSRFVPRPELDGQGHLIMDVPLPYSPDANNDGEHLGMATAGKWADGVARMVEQIRSHS